MNAFEAKEMPGISMLDLQVLADKFPDLEVDFSARPAKGLVELTTLKAKKTAKPGTGTAFMQALCQWADHHKVMLILQTGVHERADRKSAFKATTSKSRLKEFYGRFGFVSNYGRRTYRPDLPGSMHRYPLGYQHESLLLEIGQFPDLGGFTSAPPVLAGKKLGAKTFLHESRPSSGLAGPSNTIPGRANRWLAHIVFPDPRVFKMMLVGTHGQRLPIEIKVTERPLGVSVRFTVGANEHAGGFFIKCKDIGVPGEGFLARKVSASRRLGDISARFRKQDDVEAGRYREGLRGDDGQLAEIPNQVRPAQARDLGVQVAKMTWREFFESGVVTTLQYLDLRKRENRGFYLDPQEHRYGGANGQDRSLAAIEFEIFKDAVSARELIKSDLGESIVEAKDQQLSALWSDRVGAVPKSCWSNSVQVLRKNKSPGLKYVEGFARRSDGLVFEHGWIEAPGGTVIDATLPDDDLEYFPGVRYSREEIFKKNRYTAPFVWGGANGFGGFKNPGYKDAHDKAWSKLMGIKEGGQILRQPFLERVLFVHSWMPTSLVWWDTFAGHHEIEGPMTLLRLELSVQAMNRSITGARIGKPLHYYNLEISAGGVPIWLDASSADVQMAMRGARDVYAQTVSEKPFEPRNTGEADLLSLPISLAMAESEKLRAEMKSDIKARLGESEESDRGESDRVFAEFNLKDKTSLDRHPGTPPGYWNIKVRLDSGRSRRTGTTVRGDFSATVQWKHLDSSLTGHSSGVGWEVFGDTLAELISNIRDFPPNGLCVDIAGAPHRHLDIIPTEQMFSHPWIKSTLKDEVAARLGEGLLQEFHGRALPGRAPARARRSGGAEGRDGFVNARIK